MHTAFKYILMISFVCMTLIAFYELGFSISIVEGTSMKPTIMPGTVVVLEKTSFSHLKIGSIIVFRPYDASFGLCNAGGVSNSFSSESSNPCFVIHRIISIQNGAITTKGDNNPSPINGIDTNVTSSRYLGKVVLQIPYLAYATQEPYNILISLGLIAFLLVDLSTHGKTSQVKETN